MATTKTKRRRNRKRKPTTALAPEQKLELREAKAEAAAPLEPEVTALPDPEPEEVSGEVVDGPTLSDKDGPMNEAERAFYRDLFSTGLAAYEKNALPGELSVAERNAVIEQCLDLVDKFDNWQLACIGSLTVGLVKYHSVLESTGVAKAA